MVIVTMSEPYASVRVREPSCLNDIVALASHLRTGTILTIIPPTSGMRSPAAVDECLALAWNWTVPGRGRR